MSGSIKLGILVVAVLIGTILIFKLIGSETIDDLREKKETAPDRVQLKLESIVPVGNHAYGLDRSGRVYLLVGPLVEKVYFPDEKK